MSNKVRARLGLKLHVEHFAANEGSFQQEPFASKVSGFWREYNKRFPGSGVPSLDKVVDFLAEPDAGSNIFCTLNGTIGTSAIACYHATPATGMAIITPGQDALETGDKLRMLYVKNTHASQTLTVQSNSGAAVEELAVLPAGEEMFVYIQSGGHVAGTLQFLGSGAATTFEGFAVFEDVA